MPAPSGHCAEHPDVPATFECPRCGDYGCRDCERRVTPAAMPICASCWSQREKESAVVEAKQRLYFPKVALWIGLGALVPCVWPLQVGGIILGIVALARAGGDPRGQAYAAIGLVASICGLAGSLVLLGLMGTGAFD